MRFRLIDISVSLSALESTLDFTACCLYACSVKTSEGTAFLNSIELIVHHIFLD